MMVKLNRQKTHEAIVKYRGILEMKYYIKKMRMIQWEKLTFLTVLLHNREEDKKMANKRQLDSLYSISIFSSVCTNY
jgi:hypothetical protein